MADNKGGKNKKDDHALFATGAEHIKRKEKIIQWVMEATLLNIDCSSYPQHIFCMKYYNNQGSKPANNM